MNATILYAYRTKSIKLVVRAKIAKSRVPDREYVAGLEKGLSIIEVFGRRQSALTVSEASPLKKQPL